MEKKLFLEEENTGEEDERSGGSSPIASEDGDRSFGKEFGSTKKRQLAEEPSEVGELRKLLEDSEVHALVAETLHEFNLSSISTNLHVIDYIANSLLLNEEGGEEGLAAYADVDFQKLQYIAHFLQEMEKKDLTLEDVERGLQGYTDFLIEKDLGVFKSKLKSEGIYFYDAFSDIRDIQLASRSHAQVTKKECATLMDISGESEAHVYRARLELLKRRCKGIGGFIFHEELRGGLVPKNSICVSMVDGVRYMDSNVQHLFGVLGYDPEGQLCLQGTRHILPVRFEPSYLSKAGMYCDGHVVVAGGTHKADKRFWISQMIHPPRDRLAELENSEDLFGGSLSDMDLHVLKELEIATETNGGRPKWVALSNVTLDNFTTLKALDLLFSTLVAEVGHTPLPTGFVFLGDFSEQGSETRGANKTENYNFIFERFARRFIKDHPLIVSQCYLVFVPGPGDPGVGRGLVPRMPLLNSYTGGFKELIEEAFPKTKGKVIFATNPCRIRHLSRKMIFFRRAVMWELQWNAIRVGQLKIGEEEVERAEIENKIAHQQRMRDFQATGSTRTRDQPHPTKPTHAHTDQLLLCSTIVGQAHIFPNRLDGNIIKNLDPALRLHPLPDWICLSDTSCNSFERKGNQIELFTPPDTNDANITNQGQAFGESRKFLVYDVLKNTVETYSLPGE